MQGAVDVLDEFGVAHEVRVVSAHRTPEVMYDYARTAADRGLRVIIAGAGGAAHLPGMTASMTSLPVIGVPVPLQHLDGLDSLLSIVQMPDGIPVATVGWARRATRGSSRCASSVRTTTRCARSSTTTAPRSTRRCGRRTAVSGVEDRLALLDERSHALDPLRRARRRRDRLGLAGEVRLERVLEAGVEQSLGRGEGLRRAGRELGRQRGGARPAARRRGRPA